MKYHVGLPILKIYKPKKCDTSVLAKTLHDMSAKEYDLIKKVSGDDYVFFDTFKHKATAKKISHDPEILWHIVKMFRNTATQNSMIAAEDGSIFTLSLLPKFSQILHDMDVQFGVAPITPELKTITTIDKTLLMNSLMEEAIASSILEGASTTRLVAKRMLQEGRKPQSDSEQMIANNFAAMSKIQTDFVKKPLTREMIFELHEILIQNTKHEDHEWQDIAGRLRNDDEDVVVHDNKTIAHIPPKHDFVSQELDRLIEIANGKHTEYIHPIVCAATIHFWLGYLHPFVDGNGRLARALFYWYVIRNGYPLFGYLPISQAILEAPKKYSMAYVYSEQDDYDLTYFIDFHIQKIQQAIHNFHAYLAQKEERKKSWQNFTEQYQLNNRQLEIIRYLNKKGVTEIITQGYQKLTRCSLATAIKDLRGLCELGLIEAKTKQGRKKPYVLTEAGKI